MDKRTNRMAVSNRISFCGRLRRVLSVLPGSDPSPLSRIKSDTDDRLHVSDALERALEENLCPDYPSSMSFAARPATNC